MTELSRGWTSARLSEICEINPRVNKATLDPASDVTFVPMPAVEAETGNIDVSETRIFETVRNGYTPFRKDDVLFAKITPCMENGKMAIVPDLASTYGFGSTEFHVLRPRYGVDPRFIYHNISNRAFRFHAEHNMTGAVGQKRVPAAVLEEHEIGLPPTNEQRRIVERIEALFDEIDRGVENLRDAKTTIGLYRQSLLKSAFEGHLTAGWRAENLGKVESLDAFLARIRKQREARHRAALHEWEQATTEWRNRGKKGKKPTKPKRPNELDFLGTSDHLPWPITRVQGVLSAPLVNGRSVKDKAGGFPVLRLTALKNGKIDFLEFKEGNWGRADAKPFLVEFDDIFIARGNGSKKLVGIAGHVQSAAIPVAFPDTMIRVRLDTKVVRPDFFLLLWNSWTMRQQIERAARTTAGIYKINQNHISGFVLPLPCLAEQAEIVYLLDIRLETVDGLESEIDASLARAKALRQSILRKAFSGELVPQDPDDEPASTLLARIRARSSVAPATQRRRARA